MTEKDKRDAGLWYDANFDEVLLAERAVADEACHRLNAMEPGDPARYDVLRGLLGAVGRDVVILEPFFVDYGYNVRIGDGTFINHGAYLMDGTSITIGNHVFIGPNFGAYVAQHPLVAEERNRGLERALPITVGDDVWIGGDVKVMPGVTIGSGSVIGAGSVVTRDVPSGVVALGSPCRVMRPITAADRVTPGP